jgi:predicted ribosome quality control (RQC) complex YloA/Tae2 family protein
MVEMFTEKLKMVLKGRTISEVRYLTNDEVTKLKFKRKSICLTLDNGTNCVVSSDTKTEDGGIVICDKNMVVTGILPTL